MPLADAILDGIGFTIGGKVVEHLHKKMTRRKNSNPKRTNSGEFIGVRINSGKVQLKLPNKNPGTLAAAKKVADKLGYRINTYKTPWIEAYPGPGPTGGVSRIAALYQKYGNTESIKDDMETLSKSEFNKKYPIPLTTVKKLYKQRMARYK